MRQSRPVGSEHQNRSVSALIALGGNVGDVRATFRQAILDICDLAQACVRARSADYMTPPWGDTEQPHFINACIEIETVLDPHALLRVLHAVETRHGRDRARETRWGPRPLDLDLIAYDDLSLAEPGLTLPHPRLFERAFVLVPLAEIAPDRIIAGQRVRAALTGLSAEGIGRCVDEPDCG
jgi:2-amino-4-hydroxy-6-hydroxymethyldihydropteridine diphosphokinase